MGARSDRKRRLANGEAVVRLYAERNGGIRAGRTYEEWATDMVTDLMHWLESKEIKPWKLLCVCKRHWEAERGE